MPLNPCLSLETQCLWILTPDRLGLLPVVLDIVEMHLTNSELELGLFLEVLWGDHFLDLW